jgi:hypothetical protein
MKSIVQLKLAFVCAPISSMPPTTFFSCRNIHLHPQLYVDSHQDTKFLKGYGPMASTLFLKLLGLVYMLLETACGLSHIWHTQQ